MYKNSILSLLAVSIVVLTPMAYAKTAQEYLKTGIQYLEKDKLKEAEVNLKKAIRLNPKLAEAYSKLGNVYLNKKDSKTAIKYYQKAISINPKFAPAYCNLGAAYGLQGHFALAEKNLNKALSLSPKDKVTKDNIEHLYSSWADDLFTKNKFKEALVYYQKLLKIDPSYSDYQNNVGVVYLRMINFDLAEKYFKKAISLDEENSDAYFNIGLIYSSKISTEIENIEKGKLNKDPNIISKYILIANDNFEKSCDLGYEEACDSLEGIERIAVYLGIKLKPVDSEKISQLIKLGKEAFSKKEFNLAIEKLDEALELDPENKEAIIALRDSKREYGDSLIKQGKNEEGHALLKEALALGFLSAATDEGNPLINMLQAIKFNEEKQPEKAIEVLEKITKKGDFEKEINEVLLSSYLNMIDKSNKDEFSKNFEYFKKAKELTQKTENLSEPFKELIPFIDQGLLITSLGIAGDYVSQDKYKEAEPELEKLLVTDPNNFFALSTLGYCKVMIGDSEDGFKLMKKAIESSPKDSFIHYNIAAAYSVNNQKNEAINYLEKALQMDPSLKNNLKGKDFDNIRDSEEFRSLSK